MKKTLKFLLLMLIPLCFIGCSKEEEKTVDDGKEYYQNTTLEKFETFTSLTGIESNIVKNEADYVLYNYLVDNDAEGNSAILKFENYIAEFGFVKSDEYSAEGLTTYMKDNYPLMVSCIEVKENILQYVIIVPKDKAPEIDGETNSTSSEDKEVEHLKSLVSDKKYEEAVNYYNNSSLRSEHFDNDDEVKKYFFYAEANMYLEAGYYGSSYRLLNDYCKNFLDSNKIKDDIYAIVSPLNGVYENISVGYSGMYICIKDGRASYELSSNGLPSSAYYNNDIAKYTFTTGKTAFATGTAVLDDIDYVIQILDNGNLLIAAVEGSEYSTFSGVYEKRNLSLPSEK